MTYKIIRHDKNSDGITDQLSKSLDEAYDLLEKKYSYVCCSVTDYNDQTCYEMIEQNKEPAR